MKKECKNCKKDLSRDYPKDGVVEAGVLEAASSIIAPFCSRDCYDEFEAKEMKIEYFFNNEDEETVRTFVQDLVKEKDLEQGEFHESGGLGVRYEDSYDGDMVFEVHRLIATITVSKRRVKELKEE